MVNRIQRWFISLGYASRKAYWKIVTAKPSVFIVASIVVALSIFLLGGGVFNILERNIMLSLPVGRSVLTFFPGVHQQVVLGSLFVMVSYFFGVAGILLMYQSTKYAYKPRQAFMLLIVGALFTLMAYIYIENRIWLKITWRPPSQ